MKNLKKSLSIILTALLLISTSAVGLSASAKSVNPLKATTVKINVKTSKKITLYNPYKKEYKLKIADESIAKLQFGYLADGTNRTYNFKGLKKGTTTVKVKYKGKVIDTFKISVGNYDTTIKDKFKNTTFKYNSHGSNAYMSKSNVSINKLLADKKHKSVAKYTAESADTSIVDTTKDGLIYATGTGKTKVTIYEHMNSKKTKVGTIKVKVVDAKMNYVARENANYYDEGIFGQGENCEYLYVGETFDVEARILKTLINNEITGSKFKKSQYTITYSIDKEGAENITVTKDGVATALKFGSGKIDYVITFIDGSKYKNTCNIWVEEE